MTTFVNPFTPSFGEVPLFMAGREAIISAFTRAFEQSNRSPELTTLVTGARGTGKTALLALLAEQASARGWIAANSAALPGMLEDLYEQARANGAELLGGKRGRTRLSGIGLGGIASVQWQSADAPEGNWRTRMSQVIGELNARGTGLLITVDEVRGDLGEMVQLAAVYQQFVRERKRVALVMAGLPYHISLLQQDQSASFLRRAQLRQLGRIADADIADALVRTIREGGRDIADSAVKTALAGIEGFPFMMQLVGYRMWENAHGARIGPDDAQRGVALAKEELAQRVLEATWHELSDGDIAFLAAMLPDEGESSVKDIAARLGKSSGHVSTYRKRLLEAGVIGQRRRGHVGFELPAFGEFLAEKLGDA